MDSGSLLFENLEAYGADMRGIEDRFTGDKELYQLCLLDFIEEVNFKLLESAMESENYQAAFESAHALKGLSGNLGLSGFYDTVCVLVESLRAKSYGGIRVEYEAVKAEYLRVVSLLSESPKSEKEEAKDPEAKEATAPKKKLTLNKMMILVGFALALAVVGVSLLFSNIIRTYGNTVECAGGQISFSHIAGRDGSGG